MTSGVRPDSDALSAIRRFSEKYQATGGLAAVGVLNQLGRPDMEPAEVLVREALQNCWDAKNPDREKIDVLIGRVELGGSRFDAACLLLTDPPDGLPLKQELREGVSLLYFADYGTGGLAGPVRADTVGEPRDYIDFVLNIGQPPDKDLAGGSFGYGKAAFYLASKARTVIVDTLCRTPTGAERRLIACALGENYSDDAGQTYTGRHWWGSGPDNTPEPLTGGAAAYLAEALGLPRRGRQDYGTTVALLAPNIHPDRDRSADAWGIEGADASDQEHAATMRFLAEAVVWNFWPRMVDTVGGQQATLGVKISDNGRRVVVPDVRTHPRLRGFVDALDRLRFEPQPEDDGGLIIDREITRLRPHTPLGRVVIARGPLAPRSDSELPLTRGARATRDGVHHVALFRAPEIVVTYLAGDPPVRAEASYSGVFNCSLETDSVFKAAEPPTHDDWVSRTVPVPDHRSMVKVALDRIRLVCREAAGTATVPEAASSDRLPLGELSDSIARFLPSLAGGGARYPNVRSSRRDSSNGRPPAAVAAHGSSAGSAGAPVTETAGEPRLGLDEHGRPVVNYPFRLRARMLVTMTAAVEVMNRDGDKPENDPPAGSSIPAVRAWVDPTGHRHSGPVVESDLDGQWVVVVDRERDVMVRVDISAVPAAGAGTSSPGALV